MIDFEHYNLKLIKYIKKKFIYFCLDLIKKLVNATICIFSMHYYIQNSWWIIFVDHRRRWTSCRIRQLGSHFHFGETPTSIGEGWSPRATTTTPTSWGTFWKCWGLRIGNVRWGIVNGNVRRGIDIGTSNWGIGILCGNSLQGNCFLSVSSLQYIFFLYQLVWLLWKNVVRKKEKEKRNQSLEILILKRR